MKTLAILFLLISATVNCSAQSGGILVIRAEGNGKPDSALVGIRICRQDTMMNIGDSDLTMGAWLGEELGGAYLTGYSLTGLPLYPFTLKAHSKLVMVLCATPEYAGLDAIAWIFTAKSGDVWQYLYDSLFIYGQSYCASSSLPVLFSGKTVSGDSALILCDTIINCGDFPTVYTTAINGSGANLYTVSPITSDVTLPGASSIFCVTFKPTDSGSAIAKLHISAPNVETMDIDLKGNGGCAILSASSPIIPITKVGIRSIIPIEIFNTGNYPWVSGWPIITGPCAASFRYLGVPITIAPGDSGELDIGFIPDSAGSCDATISFEGIGRCQGETVRTDLHGNGIMDIVNETYGNGFSLSECYPNPSNSVVSFSYTIPRESEIQISILDLTGRIIKKIVSDKVSAGEYSLSLNISSLPSGNYITTLVSGSTRLTRDLILLK
jgi:hypothetical protein